MRLVQEKIVKSDPIQIVVRLLSELMNKKETTGEFLDFCTLHIINKDDDCVFSGMTTRYFDRTLNKPSPRNSSFTAALTERDIILRFD